MQWTIYFNKVPQLTWINNLKTQSCHIHSIKHCIQILFIQTQTSRKIFCNGCFKNMLIAYILECMRTTFKSRLNTGCLRYISFPQKSNAYKSYFSWKCIHCSIKFANIYTEIDKYSYHYNAKSTNLVARNYNSFKCYSWDNSTTC